MAGKPSLVRTICVKAFLPEDLYAKLMLHLYSPAEGRVPKGAYQKFFIEVVNEYFKRKDDKHVTVNSGTTVEADRIQTEVFEQDSDDS